MLQIKYFYPGCEHLPKYMQFEDGLTIHAILGRYQDQFSSWTEFDMNEFTFFRNGQSASLDTILYDEDIVLILKPSFGG